MAYSSRHPKVIVKTRQEGVDLLLDRFDIKIEGSKGFTTQASDPKKHRKLKSAGSKATLSLVSSGLRKARADAHATTKEAEKNERKHKGRSLQESVSKIRKSSLMKTIGLTPKTGPVVTTPPATPNDPPRKSIIRPSGSRSTSGKEKSLTFGSRSSLSSAGTSTSASGYKTDGGRKSRPKTRPRGRKARSRRSSSSGSESSTWSSVSSLDSSSSVTNKKSAPPQKAKNPPRPPPRPKSTLKKVTIAKRDMSSSPRSKSVTRVCCVKVSLSYMSNAALAAATQVYVKQSKGKGGIDYSETNNKVTSVMIVTGQKCVENSHQKQKLTFNLSRENAEKLFIMNTTIRGSVIKSFEDTPKVSKRLQELGIPHVWAGESAMIINSVEDLVFEASRKVSSASLQSPHAIRISIKPTHEKTPEGDMVIID